jgi:uncharacterized membrane protein
MKNKYLEDLRNLLDQYNMDETEKDDIISDYSEMYDNWIDYGMSPEEVESKLGKPRSIISDLVEGYKRIFTGKSKQKSKGHEKYIALSPFVSLVIFFIIGFVYDGWVYGWMVFLLIPITAIVLEMGSEKDPHMFTALSPFLVTIVYFYIGFEHNLWHPGWLIFLLIPIVAIFIERKTMSALNLLVALSPFAALIAFFYLGEQDLWIPGWLVFLAIPMLGVLNEKRASKVFLWELLFIVGIGGYLYIGYTFEEWNLALLAFIPVVVYALLQDEEGFRAMPKEYRIVVLVAAVLFGAVGFLFTAWGISWMFFLIIPVYAINKEVEGDEKVIALMPFISLVIFFSLGWFLGLWAFSWIAFLLIPVVAIIKNA